MASLRPIARQRDAVRQNVAGLRKHAGADVRRRSPATCRGPDLLVRVAAALLRATDPMQGGLRGAPKFPNPADLPLSMADNPAHAAHTPAPDAVRLLLRRMSQGGIYDHLGGGFARYSTDAEWLVPHFEKMLYDNAQLLDLLALAHAAAPDPLYAARAAETVGWLAARHDRRAHRRPCRLRRLRGRRQRGRGGPLLCLDRSGGRRRARP